MVFGDRVAPQDSFLSIPLSDAVIEQQLPSEYDNALIDIYGDFLFVYAGKGMLKVFDLSYLPSELEEITEWADSEFVDKIQIKDRLNYLNIRGKYLYINSSKKIIIFDISNRSNITKTAELEFSNDIEMLNIAGDRAYAISVINEKYYLTVFKIKDGIIFEELGKTKLGKTIISDIEVLNAYVYLCDGNLTIFDTADPKNIEKVYSSSDFVSGKNPTVKEFEFLSNKKHAMVRSIVDGGSYSTDHKVNVTMISVDNFTDIKKLDSQNIEKYAQYTYQGFIFIDFETYKTDVFISGMHIDYTPGNLVNPGGEDATPVERLHNCDNIDLTSPPSTELSTLIPRIKNRKLKLKWNTLYENNIRKFILTRKIAVSGNMQKSSSDGKAVNYRRDSRKSIKKLGKAGNGSSYRFVDRHLKRGSGYIYLLKYKDSEGKKHLLRKFDISVPEKK